MVVVDGFEWDDENESHVRRHIDPGDVDCILEGRTLILRNKRAGTGAYKLIGRDCGGRLITVVVAATSSSTVWRPVTAGQANRDERAHADKADI